MALAEPLTGMLSKDFSCSLLGMENTSKSKKQAERGVFPVAGIMAQMPYKNMWVPSAASVPSIQGMGDCVNWPGL